MKKIITIVSIFVILLTCTVSVSAYSIDVPESETAYDSILDMPFPTNDIYGEAVLVDNVRLSGQMLNGQYYNLYRYEVPIYCLVDLCSSSSFMMLTEGSSNSITYYEETTKTDTYTKQLETTCSSSIASSLGVKLCIAKNEAESSIESTIVTSLTESYEAEFSYTTTHGFSQTITYNITESGRYRLEKRAFLYVYVIQLYTVVTSTNSGGINPFAASLRETKYYFHDNYVVLGLAENGQCEVGLMKYNIVDGKYVFDKQYYANKFNGGNDNFLVL